MSETKSDLHYWKDLLWRAFSDAYPWFGEWEGVGVVVTTLIITLVVYGVIFLLMRLSLGHKSALENLVIALLTLAATILVFSVLFFANLCFLTPKNMVTEKEREIRDLQVPKWVDLSRVRRPVVTK